VGPVQPPTSADLPRPESPAQRFEQLGRRGQRPDVDAFLAQEGPLPPEQVAAVLRVDQRQRWQSGQRVPAEDYLRRFRAVAADPHAAVDLIFHEFLVREGLDDRPDPADYLRRFPNYAAVLGPQLELHRALAAAPTQEAATLAPPPKGTPEAGEGPPCA